MWRFEDVGMFGCGDMRIWGYEDVSGRFGEFWGFGGERIRLVKRETWIK
jgi:hypothetical protein